MAVHGDNAALPVGDTGEDLDRQAKAAYARRLQEIEEGLEDANADNDLGRQEKLATEREELLAQFKASKFGARPKRGNSDHHRIRKSVCNAIKRAMVAIEIYDKAAFDHLKGSITLGSSVSYQPTERLPWSF